MQLQLAEWGCGQLGLTTAGLAELCLGTLTRMAHGTEQSTLAASSNSIKFNLRFQCDAKARYLICDELHYRRGDE